ncbi:unnamed protein product [Caretta caretta]
MTLAGAAAASTRLLPGAQGALTLPAPPSPPASSAQAGSGAQIAKGPTRLNLLLRQHRTLQAFRIVSGVKQKYCR